MIRTILVGILLFSGVFFFYIGTIGLMRFKDSLNRAHAAAKCDTLGAALSLLALVVYDGISFASMKLILTIVFLWITNPVATHLISKSVYEKNLKKNKERI
ncbi:MAG: monovalent cation/H(+) antiporter subunit G [Andreesenia angusta]|nr:monovalent cation/H(+) antiporter subunit G [Andreesenia angusta]